MKKIIALILSALMIACLLAGCGSAAMDSVGNAEGFYNDSINGAVPEKGEIITSDGSTSNSENVANNRKIIEKIYLSVQTKDFDALMEKLEAEIKNLGGYVESSSVSGNSFYDSGNRYANLTIRIPATKSSNLTDFVSENSTVTNKEIDTEDVTLKYVDIQSRITAYETEKASLEKLLAEATNLSDIIQIQDRLTDVIYQIDSYKSQLRTYDNLIDFTTITIRVSEVERVVVVEEQTVWQEIWTNLKENFEDVGNGFVRLFVFFISGIPYWLILGGFAFIVIVIAKFVSKKTSAKPKRELPHLSKTEEDKK